VPLTHKTTKPLFAMTQSIPSTYDASTEKDLEALWGYNVVFLVDDVVSKTLRSSWSDVGPSRFLQAVSWLTRLDSSRRQKK